LRSAVSGGEDATVSVVRDAVVKDIGDRLRLVRGLQKDLVALVAGDRVIRQIDGAVGIVR